jgi:class 3 adenylate cyclase/tetratricopeptide (TPR) repeat protein
MAACAGCSAENPAGKRFCGDCGSPLDVSCPVCGEPAEPGKRFCGACGAPLAAAVPEPAAVPGRATSRGPVAERRVCSVLFADLAGFTPLSESRDPEHVRELLSRYFETARTVIGRYGGTVEKFIGDAVMAVWGTPVATEGDAERAVRAALDLVAAVSVLGAEVGMPELAARAGVVTGEVAVTIGATAEGMVAGDAVNTAARIQSAATPGTVLVDATSRRLASSAIGFEDAGTHELKGKAQPQPLWRAARVLAGTAGRQRPDGLEAPLVGRDAELRAVKDFFHACAERRSPRMVLVRGPAGVGKSRLGWEFEKYIDGLAGTALWHRGRCLSYGEGVAFWALTEIVRQRLGIAEEDSAEIASGKLADGLARLLPDAAGREYVAVRLGRLLGIEVPADRGGPLAQEELFAGWRLFFERLAATTPVVVLVEDAQHADSALLDFLDHLVDWTRDLPIFVLIFARPELDEIRPGFGTGRNRSALSLDPLDPASMDALVEAIVPGMPPAARRAITAHAQGIPLFAVETVRTLVDRGIVVPRDGGYRLAGEVGELAVPESLHALLAARLDALDPATRSLVADASVVGSAFAAEALAAATGRTGAEVRAGLRELVRRGVLEVSADQLSPQRGAYRFSQEMLRLVAYETLSRRDRKARHLAVAANLRAVFAYDGAEVSDVIARHYIDAAAACPDDPDVQAIRAEALGGLVRAGERAERAGAPGQAATRYAAAAELAAAEASPAEGRARDARAAGLWERAARAAWEEGDTAASLAHAGSARRLFLAAAEDRAAARSQAIAGRALRQAGRHTEARIQLTEALAALRAEPDADTVEALRQLGGLQTFDGSPDADGLVAEALVVGQAIGADDAQLAGLFISRGIANARANRAAEAASDLREAIHLAERAGNPALLGLALLDQSDVLAASDPAGAADAARAAAGHARRTGRRDYLAVATANLTLALLTLGEWDEADGALNDAVDRDGLGDHEAIAMIRAWLAGLRGDASAVSTVLESLAGLRGTEDYDNRATLALLEALRAAALTHDADALAGARAVLGYAVGLGVRNDVIRWAWPLAARMARTLGDAAATAELIGLLDSYPIGHLPPILRAERDLADACVLGECGSPAAGPALASAVSGLRGVASPYHLAHGLLDHAAYLTRAGDTAGAAAAAGEARDIAIRLRCPPLLQRAEALPIGPARIL